MSLSMAGTWPRTKGPAQSGDLSYSGSAKLAADRFLRGSWWVYISCAGVLMVSAIVAVVGSLLGVALGFFLQYWQHRWHLADLKREAYAELLRSISASYYQACAGGSNSEDANVLKATAVIELLAEAEIAEAARRLQVQVFETHEKIRSEGREVAKEEIEKTDRDRLCLIKLFKSDLGSRRLKVRAWRRRTIH
jgi:hypothetical protein